MLSYDVVEHGKPLQVRLRETPVPIGRQVLVRVTHTGLCHSDLHFWDGYFNLGGNKKAMLSDRGIHPPITMGHEPIGVVVAVGEDVTDVPIGARRLVYPWIGCGDCWACDAELSNLCQQQKTVGLIQPGGFATHLLVPDAKFLVDVEGIADEIAAPLACAGLTSYAAVQRIPATHAGDWVAVLGCGGVGMTAISILHARGIENVIACDVDEAKLEAALELGAKKVLRVGTDDAAKKLAQETGGRLAGAIDFVGQSGTFALAYAALRKGGTYVLVGLHGGELNTPLPPVAQRSISIVGSFVGSLQELRETVELAKVGKLVPPPTQVRDGRDINQALIDLVDGKIVGRAVLDFSNIDESEAVPQ